MNPRRSYPGIGHAVLMTLGMMMLQGMFALPAMLVVAIASGKNILEFGSVQLTPALLGVVNVLTISCIVWWGYAVNKVSWRTLLPLTRVSAVACAAVVLTGLGLTAVLSEADNLLRSILPIPEWFIRSMGGALAFEDHPWATAILLAGVAPLTEEPLFRGVILRGLLARNSPRVAIVVSAALFGLAHGNPWQFVSATLLGLVFGWYFLRTRSLLPCIVGHAVNNGMVVVASLVAFDIPGFSGGDGATAAHQPWWFTTSGVLITAGGLWFFARATKSFVPPPLPVSSETVVPPPPLPPFEIGPVPRVEP